MVLITVYESLDLLINFGGLVITALSNVRQNTKQQDEEKEEKKNEEPKKQPHTPEKG